MPLPVLVVDRHPAVQEGGEGGRVEGLLYLDREQRLRLIEQEAAVAIGGSDQRVARPRREGEGPVHQRFGAIEKLAESLRVEPEDRTRPRLNSSHSFASSMPSA